MSTKTLVLDYSTDRSEATATLRWLPGEAQVTTLFIDTEESFPDNLARMGFTHVIHSGSALSVMEQAPFTVKAVRFIRDARDGGISQMGICYGHQLLCLALVGENAVRKSPKGLEAGWREVSFDLSELEIPGVGERERVWQSHFDEVTELPEGSILFGSGTHTRIQGCINHQQRLFATQFHPEFDRDAGNKLYLDEGDFLSKHEYNADELVKGGPSIETGVIFFSFFLDQFAV